MLCICLKFFKFIIKIYRFDLPCHEVVYYDKGKIKKWNRLLKRQKSTTCSTSSGKVSAGNSPIEGAQNLIDPGFIFHLKQLKEFLMDEKSK